jgi:hypothetical protein
MTTRVRSTTVPSTYGTFKLLRNGSVISTVNTKMSSYSKSIEDVVTKDYHKRKRSGEIINNPCTLTESSTGAGGGSGTFSNGTYNYTTQGPGSMTLAWLIRKGYPPGIQYADVDVDHLVSVAKQKALGNMDRAPYSFAEDIGEIRETMQLLRDPLAAWRNLHYALMRRSKSLITNKRYNVYTAIAQAWAEYRFALTPTIRSVFSLAEALNAPPAKPLALVRSAEGYSGAKDMVIQPSLKKSWSGGYDEYHHSHHKEVLAKAYILYKVENPIQDWRFKYGLRWRDIPETAWALYPYSFMVDRVTDITTTIRGLAAYSDPKVSILGGGVVTRSDTAEFWQYLDQYDEGYEVHVTADIAESKSFTYNRTPWEPSVLDTFAGTNFRGLIKDATKIADLAALVTLRVPGI